MMTLTPSTISSTTILRRWSLTIGRIGPSIMSSRALSFCLVLLICMLGVLAWRHFVLDRQIVTAAFVDAQY